MIGDEQVDEGQPAQQNNAENADEASSLNCSAPNRGSVTGFISVR
jgi:hypothetical protein